MAEIREFYNLAQIETEWGIARHVAKKYIEDKKVPAVKEPNARSRDGIQYQVRYEDVCTMKRLIQEEKEAKAQIHAEREERKTAREEREEWNGEWMKEEFAKWKEARSALGLLNTKGEFCRLIGINNVYFSRYASGSTKPSTGTITAMKMLFANPEGEPGDKMAIPVAEEKAQAAEDTVLDEVIPEVKATEEKVFCITEEAYLKAIGNAYTRGLEYGMKLAGRINK